MDPLNLPLSESPTTPLSAITPLSESPLSATTSVRNAANAANAFDNTISNTAIPKEAQNNFSEIIGFTNMQDKMGGISIQEFIRKFNGQCSNSKCNLVDLDFFTRAAQLLPPITATTYSRLRINGNEVKLITKGSYGRIYQTINSYDKKIYKQLLIGDDDGDDGNHYNKYYRNSFVEAYIQTVLQTDTDYGKNICTLKKIYFEENKGHIFYEMEPLDFLFCQYTANMPLKNLAPLMRELGNALSHFDTLYGFRHRDLHTGNVMIKDDTLKILDFGKACFTLKKGELRITHSSENVPCESYDLLIFLVSIFLYCNLQGSVKEVIMNILTGEPFGNIYHIISDIFKIYKYAGIPTMKDYVVHYMYPEFFKDDIWQTPWSPTNKRALEEFIHAHYDYIINFDKKNNKEKKLLEGPSQQLIQTLHSGEGQTLIEAFKESTIIANLDPKTFVTFWPSPASLGGFRKTKKRSKRRFRSRKRRT